MRLLKNGTKPRPRTANEAGSGAMTMPTEKIVPVVRLSMGAVYAAMVVPTIPKLLNCVIRVLVTELASEPTT